MDNQNKYVKDMTVGTPYKLLLAFAIPLLIGNVFQQLYNMVDSVIVGRFVSANALGAIGTTSLFPSILVPMMKKMLKTPLEMLP